MLRMHMRGREMSGFGLHCSCYDKELSEAYTLNPKP